MANTERNTTWTFIKNLHNNIGVKLHFTENADEYFIFVFNGQIVYNAVIFKNSSTLLAIENQAQNDADLIDWEANFKAGANQLEKLTVEATLAANQNINVDIGLIEDDPHVSGEKGPLILGVRNDNDTTLTDTDLDRSPVAVTKEGWIKSNVEGGLNKVKKHKIVRWNAGTINVASTAFQDVYTITGPACFYGCIFHLNTEKMDFRVVINGEVVIDLDLKELKDDFNLNSGGGESSDDSSSQSSGASNRSIGCIGIREYDSKRWSYCPPTPINVTVDLKIQMKAHSGTKKIERALTSLAE